MYVQIDTQGFLLKIVRANTITRRTYVDLFAGMDFSPERSNTPLLLVTYLRLAIPAHVVDDLHVL